MSLFNKIQFFADANVSLQQKVQFGSIDHQEESDLLTINGIDFTYNIITEIFQSITTEPVKEFKIFNDNNLKLISLAYEIVQAAPSKFHGHIECEKLVKCSAGHYPLKTVSENLENPTTCKRKFDFDDKLLMILPSNYKGGDFIANYKTFSSKQRSVSDTKGIRFVLYSNEIDHKIKKVTEGTWVGIFFNIFKFEKRPKVSFDDFINNNLPFLSTKEIETLQKEIMILCGPKKTVKKFVSKYNLPGKNVVVLDGRCVVSLDMFSKHKLLCTTKNSRITSKNVTTLNPQLDSDSEDDDSLNLLLDDIKAKYKKIKNIKVLRLGNELVRKVQFSETVEDYSYNYCCEYEYAFFVNCTL